MEWKKPPALELVMGKCLKKDLAFLFFFNFYFYVIYAALLGAVQ